MMPRHAPLLGTICAGFALGVVVFLLMSLAEDPSWRSPTLAVILVTGGAIGGLVAGFLHNRRIDRIFLEHKQYRADLRNKVLFDPDASSDTEERSPDGSDIHRNRG